MIQELNKKRNSTIELYESKNVSPNFIFPRCFLNPIHDAQRIQDLIEKSITVKRK